MSGFGETELPGNLLDGDRRILKEGFSFGNSLVSDPGAYGFAGFTFDNVTQIVRMQVLDFGIVLDTKDLCLSPFHEIPVVLLQRLFKSFDDLGRAIAFIDRVVLRPEVFFYFKEHHDE